MTRLKPRKLDKIKSGIAAVDKVTADRSDLNDSSKIKELEDQMDNGMIDLNNNLGINNSRNLNKKIRKTHKGLR